VDAGGREAAACHREPRVDLALGDAGLASVVSDETRLQSLQMFGESLTLQACRAIMYRVTGLPFWNRQIGSPFLRNGGYLGPPWRRFRIGEATSGSDTELGPTVTPELLSAS
jgi:hypothetical protein